MQKQNKVFSIILIIDVLLYSFLDKRAAQILSVPYRSHVMQDSYILCMETGRPRHSYCYLEVKIGKMAIVPIVGSLPKGT